MQSRAEPMVWVACAWVVGLGVGTVYSATADLRLNVWGYLAAGVLLWVGAVVMWMRGARMSWWMVIGVVPVAAVWWSAHDPAMMLERGLGAMIDDEGKLMCVEGVVREGARIKSEELEGLARFTYWRPTTSFVIDVDTVIGDEGRVEVGGGLVVSMPEVYDRMEAGDRVRCVGWARRIGGRMNPGEFDFRGYMLRQGVVGRLGIENRGNAKVLRAARDGGWSWRHWRGSMQREAMDALRYGVDRESEPESAAIVEAIVLGGRSTELSEIYESFRRTGLAHVLSISGLNVGILAAGAWWGVLVLSGRPRWAAIAGLGAVVGYLLVVPWGVPIVRAGFMTAVCCIGMMWSRRISAMSIMAIIALVWLIARPGDLVDPGFQLSFGIVAALLLFTGPVARWMLPRNIFEDYTSRGLQLRQYGAEYVAVSAVAWLVSAPIVAYHFQMFSTWAVLINVLTFPLWAVLLWVGMLKVVATMIWPAGGEMVGGLLAAVGRWCADVVDMAANVPGSWFILPQPGVWWVLCVLAVIAAVMGGWFARRELALAAVILICVGWLYVPGWAKSQGDQLEVHMLAVGDGSCYVIRSGGRAMMFDCGSNNFAQIGTYSVVPALRALGVGHIEALFVSHPDLDHFVGALDVVEGVRVDRVVTTVHTLEDAAGKPRGASAYLLEQLKQRGVEVETIEAGWGTRLGEVEIEAIWPPGGVEFTVNNDASIVLSLRAGGRRVLLCGDIQEEAMAMMMESDMDLVADVTELPHHGSFPPGAVEWVKRVGAEVVLQSTGERRLRWDKWEEHLGGMSRCVTAEDGMVSLRVGMDGEIGVEQFRK